MVEIIIKKDSIFILTKKNFTKTWKLSYLYILKENDKSFFVLFKSNAGIQDCDIPKYIKEKNSNIIVSETIHSRVVVKKSQVVYPKLKNSPTNYIFSVEFGITASKH
ncbi:hypothetical protein MXB_4056 [Myxobolus squamalis]|nr:hypothetical protein MXB_4056 [Myxobolus squamalis]